jgi:hypothetical protein
MQNILQLSTDDQEHSSRVSITEQTSFLILCTCPAKTLHIMVEELGQSIRLSIWILQEHAILNLTTALTHTSFKINVQYVPWIMCINTFSEKGNYH